MKFKVKKGKLREELTIRNTKEGEDFTKAGIYEYYLEEFPERDYPYCMTIYTMLPQFSEGDIIERGEAKSSGGNSM